MQCAATLSAEELALIQQDMELGRGQLFLEMHQKLAHWQTLPWKLLALAHWDPCVAQESARICLESYDRLTINEEEGARTTSMSSQTSSGAVQADSGFKRDSSMLLTSKETQAQSTCAPKK